jgi:hypothetical protein
MKDTILKIAKCKDGKSFYKKFPTEEAFMAVHGNEFKKAMLGVQMEKAQQGIQIDNNNNGIPDYLEMQQSGPQNQYNFNRPPQQFTPIQQPNPSQIQGQAQQWQYPNYAQQWSQNNPMPDTPNYAFGNNNGQFNTGSEPKKSGGGGFGDVMGAFSGVVEGGKALQAEKKQLKHLTTWADVSDVVVKAARSNQYAAKPKREYVRPDDAWNVVNPNQLYPSYGTGTNVLAKDGGEIKKAQMGGMMGGGGSGGGGMDMSGQMGGAQQLMGGMFNNNAGSQIGGSFGSILGPIGGLVGTMIGGFADKNPGKIKRQQAKITGNLNQLSSINYGQDTHQIYGAHLEEGGMVPYNDGGSLDLKTHWGGYAEPISQNPYLPEGGETVMFRGQSHEESDGRGNSGIGVTYGDNPVEVERGEPAVQLQDGSGGTNLTVFGNLKIPNEYVSLLGDKQAKGKKFKNYIADLSKKEEKQSTIVDKSIETINDLDVLTPFDRLKFSSSQANVLGANMKLKDIADKKINAAHLQDAINQTAEEYGVIADDLARGKIKTAKNGIKVMQTGGGVEQKDYDYLVELYNQAEKEGNGPTVEKFQKEFSRLDPETAKTVLSQYPPTAYGQKAGKKNTDLDSNFDSIFGKRTKAYRAALKLKQLPTITPMAVPETKVAETPKLKDNNQYSVESYDRSKMADIYNQVLPFIRPTDQEQLDPRQLAGEMFALSNNQLEPVQAQTYQPQLDTPYDISFQDQMNANQSDFKSIQRMTNNPAALAQLASQKYSANSKVLGEQFRANQAMRDRVYTGNRATLNDAQLKNLGIFDQQYVRQEGAKSNTKATTQAALNSIADKYAKNQLENRTLGAYENLYNYRYDAAGRAINMNPLYQPNLPYKYGPNGEITHIAVKDDKGNIIRYDPIGTQIPELATPPYKANTIPFKDASKNTTNKNGGSIVRMFK